MTFRSTFSITNGKMQGDRNGLTDFINTHEGCDVEVTLKKAGRRSNKMNRYIWSVNTIVARELSSLWGEPVTPMQVHEISKLRLNPIVITIEATGEQIAVGGSTAEMNTKEGCDYMERLALYWSDALGITIELPEQQTELKLTA